MYTGTSLTMPEEVVERWNVPGSGFRGSSPALVEIPGGEQRPPAGRGSDQRQQPPVCSRAAASSATGSNSFPINVKGCRGSSLCNLGCPNQAKQGTHRVQLPQAEAQGVEVITNCRVTTDRRPGLRGRRGADPGFGEAFALGAGRTQGQGKGRGGLRRRRRQLPRAASAVGVR